MLVLTRREEESVVIGDPHNPIGSVRVVSIRGDRIRLAFDGFAADVPIHREEVAAVIRRGEKPTLRKEKQ